MSDEFEEEEKHEQFRTPPGGERGLATRVLIHIVNAVGLLFVLTLGVCLFFPMVTWFLAEFFSITLYIPIVSEVTVSVDQYIVQHLETLTGITSMESLYSKLEWMASHGVLLWVIMILFALGVSVRIQRWHRQMQEEE